MNPRLFVAPLLLAAPLPADARVGEALPAPRHEVMYVPGYSDPLPVPFVPSIAPRRGGEGARAFPDTLAPAEQARWTVMVYMDGDNNLEDYVVNDLEKELGQLGSSGDVQVVTLTDRSPDYATDGGDWTSTKLFHIEQGQQGTAQGALADLGERNMGDPATLVEFVSWTQTYFPAEHYALVFWDHGWAWRPGNSIHDETDGDALDQDEIADALAQVEPLDVIGWDACLMATVEVMHTFRPYARALAASEDYVGWEGYQYEEALAALHADPGMDAYAFAAALAESMTGNDSRTVSAVALDQPALWRAFEDFSVAMKAALPQHHREIKGLWHNTQGFGGDWVQKDLYHLAMNVASSVPDPTLQNKAQALMVALEDAVLFEWHLRPYRGAYGVSVYWPVRGHDRYALYTPGVEDLQYYREALSLSQASSWDEFLVDWTAR